VVSVAFREPDDRAGRGCGLAPLTHAVTVGVAPDDAGQRAAPEAEVRGALLAVGEGDVDRAGGGGRQPGGKGRHLVAAGDQAGHEEPAVGVGGGGAGGLAVLARVLLSVAIPVEPHPAGDRAGLVRRGRPRVRSVT
jgi:hypothetical protein